MRPMVSQLHMRKYIVLGKLLLFAFAVILLAWIVIWIWYTTQVFTLDQFFFVIVVTEICYGIAVFIILMTGVVGFLLKRRHGNKDERWAFFWFMVVSIVLTAAFGILLFI